MRILRALQGLGIGGLRGLRPALTWSWCPVCEAKRPLVRLADDEMLVRCAGCGSSAVTLSIVAVLREVGATLRQPLAASSVYELSCRGALHRYLRGRVGALTCSEYFADTAPGTERDGIPCQDVQRLTFADERFDLCTSTEVFEHVPDDLAGFREIHRVLKPGGLMILTVPLSGAPRTQERARVAPSGEIIHLLPPHYHLDPAKGGVDVLVFRDYGEDLTERVRAAGFVSARFHHPTTAVPWGHARRILVATKGG